jgi:hypothetical protein
MATYDVTATNTNRIVRFMVQANTGALAANIFGLDAGPSAFYPRNGRIVTPTNNQLLAQLRTSLVVRGLSLYMPISYLSLAADTSANANGALVIGWDTDQFGLFFNNAWMSDTTQPKFTTADIVDTVGTGGMSSVKTKPGLATMLSNIATRSYDGGVTGPFGALSSSGAISLPEIMNFGVTSGAPSLSGGVDGTHTSGLAITLLG